MKKLKAYYMKFIRDEDGAELIEIAIGISIAAVLAAAVLVVVATLQGKIDSANRAIGDIDIK